MLVDIKNILLPLNGTGDLDAVMSVAQKLAQHFTAHLSAVVVGSDPSEIAALAGGGISASMVTEMIEEASTEAERNAILIRHNFQKFVADNDITLIEPDCMGLASANGHTASFEVLDGVDYDAMAWRSRLADMTLVPTLSSTSDPRASATLHSILFDSGRPLVIAPPTPPEHVGKRISIAWNGTAEASLALRCVLPWAHDAEAIEIVTSPEYQRRGPEAEEVVRYLRLHGISATSRSCEPVKKDIGAGLLKAADDFGADMLALGAYSHSPRFRQILLGGVTRHILENMKLTVLMSR
ncbi:MULTISPECIES: universal stress protein [Neokomagataea]|uniref:Universal stress protein UspA n=2 Tax=Neokomagataea TaxID=1223423 RepID=A0ABQ0QI91_9PROT|nr:MULTISPECIES: universal stress protein [Neokomagataea]MBR0560369.1 universal stress protein [Neokomagataea anthophila]GBR45705.1 universal stress protein UspA [Neokomagataea tanensis NBRC 106556]